MITRFGMAPRSHGMTIDAFRHHWRTSHADAAGQIPGLRRYTQNHSLLDDHGHYLLGYPGFDACSELDFDSVQAMDEGFASETYRNTVVADENDFVDKTRFSIVVTDATVVMDGPAEGIKLMRFFRVHPSSDVPALMSALTGPVRELLGASGTRFVVNTPVTEPYAAPPASFDAVATLWVADRSALDALLSSEAWQDSEWQLAGVAAGSVALAAETVEVV